MYKRYTLGIGLSTLLTYSYLQAGGDFVTPSEPYVDMPIVTEEVEDILHFGVFMSGGMSFVNVEATPSGASNYNDGALDDNGGVLDFGFKYRFNKSIFSTVNYQITFLDMAKIYNFYATLNWQFSDSDFAPYVGVLYGGSRLTWSEDPNQVLIDKDLTSESPMYGMQIGLRKGLKENVAATARYQLLKYDHELDIQAGRKNIKHTMGQNVMVGVEYEF